MKKDFILYKFYNGEASNPYDWEKQNAPHLFWGYERFFERLFSSPEFVPDIWLKNKNKGPGMEEWKEIIEKKPIDKEEFFNLWLFELLMEHLPDKCMSGPSYFNDLYWDTTSMSM